ncbi:MAG: class I SAM-dependent methyltransferase [Lyngbya sp. HA4199-MV5]|jgi:predicted SAM-dependent methyltransferase|nr:class I SAM-dependent methyltransferase [Lyngbya sp. HA4199-MV5]
MTKTRNDKLLHYITPANQVGVEIGPLTNPIVTRDMGSIYYIDHASTEDLQAKYANDPATDISKIVDVDYIWGERSLAELTQNKQPFDYLIASHVIEHVPDLIGWLNEIRAILKPGGILSLAVPDKRQCFDYERQLTRLSDVFEAYLCRRKKPSSRQIFDHVASIVHLEGKYTWSKKVDETAEFTRYYSLNDAQVAAKSAFESDVYHDVHCWVFTPNSFFKLLRELAELGLLQFEVIQFYETTGCEFYVSLRAVDHAISPSSIQLEPEGNKPLQLRTMAEENEALREQFGAMERLQQETEQLLMQEQQERSHLQACIKAMESSKFWRMRMAWFKLKQALRFS